MPARPKGIPKDAIKTIPFAELYSQYTALIAHADASGGTVAPPPPWRMRDGRTIDGSIASNLAYSVGDRFAFHVYDAQAMRYTIIAGNTGTMAVFPLVTENQFYTVEDCIAVIKEYVTVAVSYDDIARAYEKGRGSNYDAIIKYAGNRSRQGSLAQYRDKMRGRQYPLKVAGRFDWLVDMIERKQITAAQLETAYKVAEDLEASAEGRELPHNINMEQAKRAFVAGDSGEDAE